MRKFYELFNNKKLTTLLSKLSWPYFSEVLSLKNVDEIIYYLNECIDKTLTVRQLHEFIKNKEYDRLPIKTKNKLLNKYKTDVFDMTPNPIVIKSDKQIEKLSEYALKELILNQLDDFLLQLGNGFTYIGNEYKIKIGDRYNYIDLFLYNIKYKCYIVIELKVTELNSYHTGQIQKYMNYGDKSIKTIDENDTVGIIICRKNNEYVYCSDERILSKEYELVV